MINVHTRSIISTEPTGRDKFTTRDANWMLFDYPCRSVNDRELEWLVKAGNLALLSDRGKQVRTGCIILQKNKVFSHGWNSYRTHPFQHKWNPHNSRVHAETVAILHAQKCGDFEPTKATVVVTRMSRSGAACSYPCIYCWGMLSHLGINKILCYDYNNQPIRIDIK